MGGHRRAALLAVAVAAAVAALLAVVRRRGRDSGSAIVAEPAREPPEPPREPPEPAREPAVAVDVDALEGLTRAELYERAQAIDLPGRSKMSKAELRAALSSRG